MAQAGFVSVFGPAGEIFIAVALLFFAFSTIVGWFFFGAQNVRYLVGGRFVKPYALLVCLCVLVGAVLKVEMVWSLTDLFNGMMVIPNLMALLWMSNQIVRKNKEFEQLRKRK